MTNDLISRDALAEKFKKAKDYAQSDLLRIILGDVVDAIEEAPAVDAAPVVHGRWTEIDASYWRWRPDGAHLNFRLKYRHDECGKVVIRKENFCPNCGAKMDKEAENAQR